MPIVHVTAVPGLRVRSYSPQIARAALVDAAVIEARMAADMRELAAALGGVTADDLAGLGWQFGQIAAHGARARRRAEARAARECGTA